jgi:SAM-dependent methyltransferase
VHLQVPPDGRVQEEPGEDAGRTRACPAGKVLVRCREVVGWTRFPLTKRSACFESGGVRAACGAVNDRDALALLRAAVPAADGAVWADLGAGTGVFTRALAALVGPGGHVYAVDVDDAALAVVRAWAAAARPAPAITVMRADLSRPLVLPPLDGAVMANVLHFLRDAEAVLAGVAAHLRPVGRLVLIEYEGRRPSRWVPYPVSAVRFRELAAAVGLTPPEVVATRPSAFGGELYVAVAVRGG